MRLAERVLANVLYIVDRSGARADKGMASFSKVLAEGQSEAIYHYIVSQANKEKAALEAKR